MKIRYYIWLLLISISCSSTKIKESWRNPVYSNYQPKRVLLLGVTNNLTARKIYEEKLKKALIERRIDAAESYDVFEPSFTDSKQTKEAIRKEVELVSEKGFDAILISTILGVDEKSSYDLRFFSYNPYSDEFGHYYYLNQEIYHNNQFFENYKVYHIEISLFDLRNDADKSLVWVASYDIVDPQKMNSTIRDCVTAIITSLEAEGIIPTKQERY